MTKEMTVIESVESRIAKLSEDNQIHFPEYYSVSNALKSAWLVLQNVKDREKKPALEVCTKESIANALFNMTIQGLSAAKNQGYFIVYGKELIFFRSYYGSVSILKRMGFRASAIVVYEGDEVEVEVTATGRKIVSHTTKFNNINKNKIQGAYCNITDRDNNLINCEIMTIDQIAMSWSKSKNKDLKKAGTVHGDFTEEMSKRTVINRAAKQIVNTSDDSDLLIHTFNKTTEAEYTNDPEKRIVTEEPKVIDVPVETETKVIEAPKEEKKQISVVDF